MIMLLIVFSTKTGLQKWLLIMNYIAISIIIITIWFFKTHCAALVLTNPYKHIPTRVYVNIHVPALCSVCCVVVFLLWVQPSGSRFHHIASHSSLHPVGQWAAWLQCYHRTPSMDQLGGLAGSLADKWVTWWQGLCCWLWFNDPLGQQDGLPFGLNSGADAIVCIPQ